MSTEAGKAGVCPACGSQRVRGGGLLGGGESGAEPAGVFQPDNRAGLLLKRGVPLPNRYTLCLDCGLFWQYLDADQCRQVAHFERDCRIF